MKKIIKKVEKVKEVELPKAETCNQECVKPKIDKLTLSFPNADLNTLVEKINEIIENNGN